jgi:hypothetical protein
MSTLQSHSAQKQKLHWYTLPLVERHTMMFEWVHHTQSSIDRFLLSNLFISCWWTQCSKIYYLLYILMSSSIKLLNIRQFCWGCVQFKWLDLAGIFQLGYSAMCSHSVTRIGNMVSFTELSASPELRCNSFQCFEKVVRCFLLILWFPPALHHIKMLLLLWKSNW